MLRSLLRPYSVKAPVDNWWAKQLQSHEIWIKPDASPLYWWQRWRLRRPNA